MKEITFSRNWNGKLGCDYFTTLRLHNPIKYQVGNHYRILCDQADAKMDFAAECVAIHTVSAGQITDTLAMIDAGMRLSPFVAMLKTMYKHKVEMRPDTPFDLIYLKKIK